MTDQTPNGNGRPRLENRISAGNIISIAAMLVAVVLAWGTLSADFKALAQRVDIGDKRDEKAADLLSELKNSLTRIETEQKAVRAEAERLGRQIDRIEVLIRNGAPAVPPRGNP